MSDIKYGIQYENYCSTLMSGFGKLMQKQNLVDATLMCNTHTLRVHKVMLAASSLYFQEILRNRPGELLIILKMDFIVLKSLVEYIYNGKTDVLESDMDELISAAKFLKIQGLAELKEECDNLPEFSPPLVFNQPYGSTQENFQGLEGEQAVEDNTTPSNMSYMKNPNNFVVRIPIEINSHSSSGAPSAAVEGARGRNRYRPHHYERYGDTFPKNKMARRRAHYNKQDHKSNLLGTRLLNRATRKVLRKEEKSSLQTIQQIKNLQQLEEPPEQLDLSEAVDSILSPNLNTECEEFIINNHEEQTTENVEISEQQFNDDHPNMWPMENPPDINSTLSEYVDVLKSTGLPTDVPILFELEDGSYVNISGEVLLNMVQSNSVQYEVVEHTEDTEQLLQNGITKSIDQISEEIGASGDINLEQQTNDIMECLEHTENMDKMEDCVMNDNSLTSLLNHFNPITE